MRFLTLAMVLISATVPLSAATINVSNSPNGCTLRDAIRSANDDNNRGNCSAGSGADVIIMPDNYVLTLSSNLPTIASEMEIKTVTNAGHALIDGNNNHRPFNISGTTNVTLNNLSITNGYLNSITNGGGAGLLITDSEVILNNVSIDGNRINLGLREGGGARVVNSTLTMENCTFIRNGIESLVSGNTRGANLALKDSSVNINNSTIKGYDTQDLAFNYLSHFSNLGAGIYMDNSDAIISNTLFTNQSGNLGVNLYLKDGSVAFVSNSTFYHDYLDAGAPIQLENSQIHINNSTIFSDRTEHGIVVNGGQVFLSNSYLVDNGTDVVDFCSATDALGNVISFPLSLNVNNLFPPDQSCETVSQVYSQRNLIEIPHDNGGLTHTSRLLPFSNNILNPAIDGGDPNTCEPTDQRGILRSANCDIGAYEANDSADLSIDMNLMTNPPYYFGQIIEYQINVQNLGPADVYGVNVSLGEIGLSFNHFQTNHNCFETGFGSSCEITSIANGGNVLISQFMNVEGPSSFDADAVVQINTNFSVDVITTNNTDDIGNGGSIAAAADLKLSSQLLTSPPYFIGQTLNYQLEIENLGNSTATSIVLSHPLLGGLTAIAHSGCNVNNVLTCNINSMISGSSRIINFQALVTGSVIKLSSSVDASTYDPVTLNNSASSINNTSDDSKLLVLMDLTTSGPYYPSHVVQYSIQIQNRGPDDATNVVLESIANNMTIIGGDNTCMILPCTIPVIADNGSVTINLTGIVGFSGSFSHTVNVVSDQNDDDMSDNSVTIIRNINPAADIEVVVDLIDSAPYYVGEVVEFDVVVRNNGTISASLVNITNLASRSHLDILDVNSTRCIELPCILPILDVGANNQENIHVSAIINDVGTFKLSVQALAIEFDEILANNNNLDSEVAVVNPNDLIIRNGFEN